MKKDKAGFPRKEASSPVLEMTSSFTDDAILMEIYGE